MLESDLFDSSVTVEVIYPCLTETKLCTFFIVFIIHIVNAYFVSHVQSVFECFNE